MGNIERDERAWRLSAGGPFNRAGQRQTLVYGSQLREGEEVEVVPSSRLQGAVQENERLRHIANEAYDSLRIGRINEALEYLRTFPRPSQGEQ